MLAVTTAVAWLTLLMVDLVLKTLGFHRLHRLLRAFPVLRKRPVAPRTRHLMITAVDRAVAYYFKHKRCLQRSAAGTLLLRTLGVPVEMVIGVQKIPFRAHAWIELEGVVLNDRPAVQQLFVELERV